MIAVACLIAAATAVGVGSEHRFGGSAERLAERVLTAMLWLLVPPIVFVNVGRLALSDRVVVGVLFGATAIAVTLGLAHLLATRVLRLARPSVGALMLAAAFSNTGYLGLPFVTALFGGEVLPRAIVYDLILTTVGIFTVGFVIGAAFGTTGETPREHFRTFLTRNPPIWAAVAGAVAPAALSPDWAVNATHTLVYVLPALGFFAVGVILAAEADEDALKFPPPVTRPVATALALKLLVSPAIVLTLTTLLVDVPDPYPVMSAMATAINVLMIAQQFGLDRALIASVIAWSTATVTVAGLAVALL